MNSARTHTPLHDFEASALAENDVRSWDTDILEMHFTVPKRRVYGKSEFQHPLDLVRLTVKSENP